MANLAPYLDEENKTKALVAACQINIGSARAIALVALAPYLNEENKTQALAAARQIESNYDRAKALAAFIPYLNEDNKARVLQEALAAARQLENDLRDIVLVSLVPYLNEESKAQVLQEALAAARHLKDERFRAQALADIVPYLDEEGKTQVLLEALAAACEFIECDYADSLKKLFPLFNKENIAQALAAARAVKDIYRPSVLMALAPYLNEEKQIIVLHELLYTSEHEKALTVWKQIEFRGLKDRAIKFIKFTSQKKRSDGLETVGILTPALIHFSGADNAPELYRAIVDTARWWP